MTLRSKQRWLLLAALTCVAGAVAIGVWASSEPELPEPRQVTRVDRSIAKTANTTPRGPTAEKFQPLLAQPLRRPLYDPPPPPPKKVVKPPPEPLRAKLLATMMEAENSMAMLQLDNGRVELRRVGEVISQQDADATVAEIKAGSIVVNRGGQQLTLNVEGS